MFTRASIRIKIIGENAMNKKHFLVKGFNSFYKKCFILLTKAHYFILFEYFVYKVKIKYFFTDFDCILYFYELTKILKLDICKQDSNISNLTKFERKKCFIIIS